MTAPTHTPRFDLVIVGGGASSAFTVLALIDRLRLAPPPRPVEVLMVEAVDEFWKGFAYGERSSPNSLLITNLTDFIHPRIEQEFARFAAETKASWTTTLRQEGGAAAAAWLERHARAIAADAFSGLYLPRRLFGAFLAKKTTEAIAASSALINVAYKVGRVRDVVRAGSDYRVCAEGAQSAFEAESPLVVLATGSPPVRPLQASADAKAAALVIDDAYTPSLEANLAAIRHRLAQRQGGGAVLVVGSNASALEMIYMCAATPEISDRLAALVCLSRSGQLPEVSEADQEVAAPLPEMTALCQGGGVQADALYAAIERDIALLQKDGVRPVDAFPSISRAVISALASMTEAEQARFHVRHGMNLSRIVRRGGPDYVDAASRLIREGRMSVIPGAFLRLDAGAPEMAGATLRFCPTATGVEKIHPERFDVVINCGGFETLSPDPPVWLVQTLIRAGLCQPNVTGRGVKVNERFEAAPGLFIMGPLLAGIFNARLKTWHIENARRLLDAAQGLAADLDGDLRRGLLRSAPPALHLNEASR